MAEIPLDSLEGEEDGFPPPRPMSPSESIRLPAPSLSRWFTEKVQPHEPALRAYLQARFPTLAEHDDIVQETYSRLLRAQGNGGVRYPKAFLFTAARNVAFDLFRRRGAKPTEAVTDLVELTLLEDRPGVGELIDQSYELEVLADAVRARLRLLPFDQAAALVQDTTVVARKDADGAYNPNDGTRYPAVLFGRADGDVGIYDAATNRRAWFTSTGARMLDADKFFDEVAFQNDALLREEAEAPPQPVAGHRETMMIGIPLTSVQLEVVGIMDLSQSARPMVYWDSFDF